MTAADLLRQKADDYRALGQEHEEQRAFYEIVELTLREVADALERAEHELREAA